MKRLVSVLLLLSLGCKPATRFGTRQETTAPKPAIEATQPSLPANLIWKDKPIGSEPGRPTPIEFVHSSHKDWAKLRQFWTRTSVHANVAALIGKRATPLLSPPWPNVAAPDPEVIRIKVPYGLDDPTPFVPAANPMTYEKWELGRDLFFDTSWLSAKGNVSCAGCHQPRGTFAHRSQYRGCNTPTLVNVVFNTACFWDGRASCLEEVYARQLADEEDDDNGSFRHKWGGSLRRLMEPGGKFSLRFRDVFRSAPTLDSVAKALATYQRTLLSANSLHDRAWRHLIERKKTAAPADLDAADYESVLQETDLPTLKRPGENKTDVARDLVYGYRLFHNLSGGRKLNCVNCHGGGEFSDRQFHNVGIGFTEDVQHNPFPGRFAYVPIGLKEARFIGAYKTPTLRGLGRTGSFFHDGEGTKLAEAILLHTSTFSWNPYLPPELLNENNKLEKRVLFDLTNEEMKGEDKVKMRALQTFLLALNGEELDEAVLPKKGS